MSTKQQKSTCLHPDCNGKKPMPTRMIRGLCSHHFQVARKLIKSGQTTDEKLVKAGKMLPKGHGGGRTSTASKWFEEAGGKKSAAA